MAAGGGFSVTQVKGDIGKEVRKLRTAAERGIRTELRKVVSAESKPARAAIKASAMERLPQRGGLNRFAAVLPAAKTTFTSSSVEMKIAQRKAGHDLKALNAGKVRHPVFGHRDRWNRTPQEITPGYFDRAVEALSPEVRGRVDAALNAYFDGLNK